MKVVFDSEALEETEAAAAYYEDCRPGLGGIFLDEVDAALVEIAQRPAMWRRIKGRFRRYLLHRFPYGVIYAVHEDTVYVAAVMHLKRKPEYWMHRRRDQPGRT